MYTTVSYDNLDTYLAGLAANTQDTPYEIEISPVTEAFLHGGSTASQGTLQYVLQHNATKYVSLKLEAPAELTSASAMFKNCTSLTSVDISGMTSVTSTLDMFNYCTFLMSVNLPTMESVISADEMFKNCISLTSVDVSGMTSIIYASDMFYGCTSLMSVDVSGMSSVENASDMFKNCISLTSVDVSGMTSIINASDMFYGCSSLEDTSLPTMTNCEASSQMFALCSSLATIDASGFNGSYARAMFYGCTSLLSANVSGSITSAYAMFEKCTSLTSVDISGMTNVTETRWMFSSCSSLENISLPTMTNVSQSGSMFKNCIRLTEIHGWSIPPTAVLSNCFDGCTALEAIYVPEPSPSESSWRAWDIRKDTANSRSTVTVYNPDGTSNSVSVPSAGIYTMKVTDKVDELLFSPSEEIPAATIQKMLQTKAPVTAKDALDPTKDNFALLAKDRSSARTNVTTDVIEAGNKLPPTSEAVRAAIGGAMPVGSIISYPGSVAPAGWHLCIGETKLRSDYPSLMEWAVLNDLIGDGKLFGAGDGTTTFDFPDLRELVLVGAGKSARPELDATGHAHDVYAVGEFKDDQFQSHTHKYTTYNRKRDVSWSSSEHIWVDTASTNTDTPTGRIGTTTHGKQIGMNYIIKI